MGPMKNSVLGWPTAKYYLFACRYCADKFILSLAKSPVSWDHTVGVLCEHKRAILTVKHFSGWTNTNNSVPPPPTTQ